MNFLLWTLPFLVLLLSFLSFRVDLLKPLRYKIYILILFIAFVLDLTHMSFTNDVFDTIRFLLVTFILVIFYGMLLEFVNLRSELYSLFLV